MTAHVTIDQQLQHPLIRHALAFCTEVGEWSRSLEEPRQATIKAAEAELAKVREKRDTLAVKLADLRARVVLEGVPRSELSSTRKQLAEAIALVEDLHEGIRAARQAAGTKLGQKATVLAGRVQVLAADIRERRGTILGARERDHQTPYWHLDGLQATLNALTGVVEEILAEIGKVGEVPEPIAKFASSIRDVCGQIWQEVEAATRRAA